MPSSRSRASTPPQAATLSRRSPIFNRFYQPTNPNATLRRNSSRQSAPPLFSVPSPYRQTRSPAVEAHTWQSVLPHPHIRGPRTKLGPSICEDNSETARRQDPGTSQAWSERSKSAGHITSGHTKREMSMMKKRTSLAVSIAVVMSMLAGCSTADVTDGSGEIVAAGQDVAVAADTATNDETMESEAVAPSSRATAPCEMSTLEMKESSTTPTRRAPSH